MKYHIEYDIEFRKHGFPGKLIAFEGIDGSGKTTQAHLLVDSLNKQGKKAIYTKEPTEEPTGKFIRQVLSGEIKVPPVSLQYLYGADRAVHQLEIEKYLKDGFIVVTDRYFWSSVAYGMADSFKIDSHAELISASRAKRDPETASDAVKQVQDGQKIENLDYYLATFSILSFYNQFYVPDFTFYIDIKPEVGMKRIEEMGKVREIYENREKLLKIEKGYKYLLQKFPEEFTEINGDKSVEEVTREIIQEIKLRVEN